MKNLDKVAIAISKNTRSSDLTGKVTDTVNLPVNFYSGGDSSKFNVINK